MGNKKIDLGYVKKADKMPADKPEKKGPQLSEAAAKKFEAVVTPTTIHFPKMKIDMTKMTLTQAEALFAADPGKWLKEKGQAQGSRKQEKPDS